MGRLGFFLSVALLSTSLGADELKVEAMPEGCRVETFSLQSKSMERPIPVAVILPPENAGHPEKLPVVYALHGRQASYLTFRDMARVRDYLVDHPMIVVSFQADEDSGYIDATRRPASLFTTFFFDELIPAVNSRYPVDGRQALTGFSMGGFGVMHYLLLRPELFQSASTASAAFDFFAEEGQTPKRIAWAESLLGPRSENAAAYEALLLAPRLEKAVLSGVKLPPLLFLCGASDEVTLKANRQFLDLVLEINQARLKALAPELDKETDAGAKRARIQTLQTESLIDYEYRERPGAHDWPYWSLVFRDAMAFSYENFQKPAESVGN